MVKGWSLCGTAPQCPISCHLDVEALARDFLKLEARKSELEETFQKSKDSSEETFNGS